MNFLEFDQYPIAYLLWTTNIWIMAYLDDLVGVAHPDKVQVAFRTLSNLLQALGLHISFKKVESPSHKITCLGIEIDAKAFHQLNPWGNMDGS